MLLHSMKRLLLLIACALALVARALAGPLPAASRITAVTVYPDRAVVTRSADLEIAAPGPLEIVFDQLPASLLDASLQAAGRGTAEATLLEVTGRPVYVEATPNERVKKLEDDLRALAKLERALTDRTAVLAQQRDYVVRIQTATTSPGKDSAGGSPLPDVWTRLLSFSEEQLGRIAAENQSIDEQREDLQARRTALEQQLAELRGAEGRSYKTVTVRLAAATAGRLALTLRYAVPGASWSPAYDARASSIERTAQLGYAGLVRQNTGEDWKNIELTLSTARPLLGGAAPELEPWIVQPRPAPVPMATAATNEETIVLSPFAIEGGKDKAIRSKSALARQQLRDVAPQSAAVSTQATSATFRIPDTVDVPSDNAPHKLGIATVALKTELAYRAAPKLLPSAFLTAKVTNASDFPLLAGAMNVFLDDTFVAAAELRTVMPGETFDLALGADDGIAVKRKLVNRVTEDTGLVTKGKRLTYDIALSVQNNKRTAVRLVLVDQLPVSRHEKIVVKVAAPDERELKPDADGTLKWTLDLKPGERRELPLKFSVEYPNDLPVVGLE